MQSLTFIPLDSLTHEVFGIKDADKVYVSPAVFELITRSESDEELTKIIRHLDCVENYDIKLTE